MIKRLIYFSVLLTFPCHGWAITHIVNQSFFLQAKPDATFQKNDNVIILGAENVSINELAKARKNFPRYLHLFWMMSQDNWHYSNISLNRDQMAVDFAKAVSELSIEMLSKNLCPDPTVFHENNEDIIIYDSSWFLFPHKTELFTQDCDNVDLGHFYAEIEQEILNARLKPVILVAHHGIDRKLVADDHGDTFAKFAQSVRQSLGSMNSIANPAYQEYQKQMSEFLTLRPNVAFVSANTDKFFEDSNQTIHHVAFSRNEPNELSVIPIEKGVQLTSVHFPVPLKLSFNESSQDQGSICRNYSGPLFNFKLHDVFFQYVLGSNFRKLWNHKLFMGCFDLEKEKLTIDGLEGSLRSPDFRLKDESGKFYTLSPLKKEIHVPHVFKNTMIEQILWDQQSSLLPVGFLIASNLSKKADIPSDSPKLVYVDINQKPFAAWKERKFPSGFYELYEQPQNLVEETKNQENEVAEVLTTQDMVRRLENQSGYELDQRAYLKARLFDMLIGDWDRHRDQWRWIVINKDGKKIIRPYPINRDAAFYHANGFVSWWRRQPWINYKLQDYGLSLRHPQALMDESLSMDHRFTFQLHDRDWDSVVQELQSEIPAESIEQAIKELPFALPKKDYDWLTRSFKNRWKELPLVATRMRSYLRESVDIVGTSGSDQFNIQAGPGTVVNVEEKRDGKTIYSDAFDSKHTKELRIYGLGGDDHFKLDWKNYVRMHIRLIPGDGNDDLTARDQKIKPRVSIYDDDLKIDSYYGFFTSQYSPAYNDYYSNINQRQLNFTSPVLFLASSDADSGFILGGGFRYYQDGFQKAPWASTNEIKANVVLNRSAANVMYLGTYYDVLKDSDFQMEVDAGLPRFYGSFFGLGNNPPNLNSALPEEYYWMRARVVESTEKLTIPLVQHLSIIPTMQFRFRAYIADEPHFLEDGAATHLDTILKPGTTAEIEDPNYYLGSGATLSYISDDQISGPLKKRVLRANAQWMYQQGFAKSDSHFQTFNINTGLTSYLINSKTQWKVSGGYGANYGNWEFFDAQFLGDGQNLRGFFMNRFGGKSRVFSSFEVNQSLLWTNHSVITDYGIGAYFDNGRVFLPNDTTSDIWHKSIGGQAYVTFLNTAAFKIGYAHALFEEEGGFWSFSLTTEL